MLAMNTFLAVLVTTYLTITLLQKRKAIKAVVVDKKSLLTKQLGDK